MSVKKNQIDAQDAKTHSNVLHTNIRPSSGSFSKIFRKKIEIRAV